MFYPEILATAQGEDIVWLDYEDPITGQQQAISMELADRLNTRKVLVEKINEIFEHAHLMLRIDNREGVQKHDFYVKAKYLF